MRFFMSFAVLLAFTGSSQGRLIPRDKIVLNKKEAFDFFGFFKDIDHECYEEGCTFGEVVDHYGHKEKSYEYWNTYQCEKFQKGCTGIVSGNCITFPDANIRGSKTPCITITYDKECRGNSVGIEDPDKVSGGGIVASSWLRSNLDFAPSQGRLHNEKGSWCANKQEEDPKPYLQVELPVRTGVCAVAIQGSALYDTDYVTKYEIQTSLDKENWVTYQENGTDKIFHGNTNADHMLKVNLDQPVLAMFVRFVIKEFVEWPCMRVEVYGTPANCTVRTKDNECCVFPFMYKGERHFSCLPSLFNGDWCATTHDYGKDKKWGECLEGDLNA